MQEISQTRRYPHNPCIKSKNVTSTCLNQVFHQFQKQKFGILSESPLLVLINLHGITRLITRTRYRMNLLYSHVL